MEEKFDKLDNFLRRHLNDASENQAWNVPDDAIFEKAMRSVAEGKRKKRRGWVLIPVLFVSMLMVSEYLHNLQIEKLQGRITTLENDLLKESSNTDPIASTSSIPQEAKSSIPAPATEGSHGSNNSPLQDIGTPTNQPSSPDPISPKASNSLSNRSTSKPQTPANEVKNSKPASSEVGLANKLPRQNTTTTGNTKVNTLPLASGSDTNNNDHSSNSNASDVAASGLPVPGEVPSAGIPDNTFAAGWVTDPITALVLTGVEKEEALIFPPAVAPGVPVQTKSLPVYAIQYGLLMGVNQSWLTMKNIPASQDAYLYNYDNGHPGFSMAGFVNKPVSRKFSLQGGLSYNIYNNRSILEDQFLFDTDKCMQMPDGQTMYQTDYDVVNPLGDYDMLLEFRVSDQMQENDVVVEYTTIKQTIQSLMLDLGIHYDLLTLGDFKVSLGTGLGLGYRSGLKNEFNVSTYHNGILQKSQMETPDHLDNVKRWYGQWLGNVNLGYYPTDRLGIILVTQYNTGITSIRDGGSANGPLTFLHAWSLSAGVSHHF